jgi:hypothetical protein
MIGARFGLRIAAEPVDDSGRPELLSNCPGVVARMAEQVIAPASLLSNFSSRYRDRILKIDAADGLALETPSAGQVDRILLVDPRGGRLMLQPLHVIFTAGSGNATLRDLTGLSTPAMQRRPLHMAMVRGSFPHLNGHCVDGAKTRVTITSDTDSSASTVWQIGGQLAEDGVQLDEGRLIARAYAELQAVIPGINLSDAEWATYRVDRAEGITSNGTRPDSFQIRREGNTISAWPTKLALVPQLASEIASLVWPAAPAMGSDLVEAVREWPRPRVALPPWETAAAWRRFEDVLHRVREAA